MTGNVPEPAVAREMAAALSPPAIEICRLHKTYGETVAVDDVSLSVAEGEIFGLLGPNGAGKTTTIECAVGLQTADSGEVRILGLSPDRDRELIHRAVGVQLQASALPAKLKVGELLDLYRSFYLDPADTDELAATLGLAGKRDDYYRSLSGGQRQRLSIALALVGRPRVAVLDEMTTGLDPHARRDTWDLIEHVRDRGVTVLLVTHYMEEAERLCDRVALIDQGRVVAAGTPDELVQQADAGKQVSFAASTPFDDQVLTVLPEVSGVERQGRRVEVTGTGDLASAIVGALATCGVTVHDLEQTSASLEEAFIKFTGRRLASSSTTSRGQARNRQSLGTLRPLFPHTAPRRAFSKLVLAETRLAWRQPIGLVYGLALPVLTLALLGSVFGARSDTLGGLGVAQAELPMLIVLVLAVIGLFGLPTPLATYREQGILRRLSTTPVPPAWLLGAQFVVNACIAVAGLAMLMVIAFAGFDVQAPHSLIGLVVSMTLTAAAVLGIGLAITGMAPNAVTAGGIAWLSFYPLSFFAGVFVPLAILPAVVRQIGAWTPLGAAFEALQHSLQTGFPPARFLLVLAGYAAVSGALAIRYFRWE